MHLYTPLMHLPSLLTTVPSPHGLMYRDIAHTPRRSRCCGTLNCWAHHSQAAMTAHPDTPSVQHRASIIVRERCEEENAWSQKGYFCVHILLSTALYTPHPFSHTPPHAHAMHENTQSREGEGMPSPPPLTTGDRPDHETSATTNRPQKSASPRFNDRRPSCGSHATTRSTGPSSSCARAVSGTPS